MKRLSVVSAPWSVDRPKIARARRRAGVMDPRVATRGLLLATRHSPLVTRSAFSLLELLMVVSIIVLLVGISVPVIGRMNTKAKIQATRATITKIHGLLQDRRESIDRLDILKPDINRYKYVLNQALTSAQLAQIDVDQVAEAWARKDTYARQILPQRYVDVPVLLQSQQADNITINPETESSEALYAILTTAGNANSTTSGGVFGAAPVDDDFFSPSEVMDTDGNGRKEFVDAWGKPLRFYRWPTRLVRPLGYDPNNPALTAGEVYLANLLMPGVDAATLAVDPDDPVGDFAVVASVVYGGTPEDQPGSAFAATPPFQLPLHTVATYHAPLIVSAGPDGLFGLYPPGGVYSASVTPTYDLSNYGHLGGPIMDSSHAEYVGDLSDIRDPNADQQAIINALGASTLNDNITNYHAAGAN